MFIDTQNDSNKLIQVLSDSDGPAAPDAVPTWRLYDGDTSLIGNGSLALALDGTISNVTNADPAVVTDADHGLSDGTVVKIASVGGATGVNGTFAVTRLSSSTFSVDPSGVPGVYTSGGTWEVLGLYVWEVDSSLRTLLEPGRSYTLVVDFEIGGDAKVITREYLAT